MNALQLIKSLADESPFTDPGASNAACLLRGRSCGTIIFGGINRVGTPENNFRPPAWLYF
jgi:hypothetical protein